MTTTNKTTEKAAKAAELKAAKIAEKAAKAAELKAANVAAELKKVADKAEADKAEADKAASDKAEADKAEADKAASDKANETAIIFAASALVVSGKNFKTAATNLLDLIGYDVAKSKAANVAVLKVAKSEVYKAIIVDSGPFTINEIDAETGKLTTSARLYKSLTQQLELLTMDGRGVVKAAKTGTGGAGATTGTKKQAETVISRQKAEIEDIEESEEMAAMLEEKPEISGMTWKEIAEEYELELFTAIKTNKEMLARFVSFEA